MVLVLNIKLFTFDKTVIPHIYKLKCNTGLAWDSYTFMILKSSSYP